MAAGCWKPWPRRPSAPCWRRCSACSYASEFFPPDLSAPHLRAIGRGLLETLATSAIGTLLAALLGLL
ncbi:hypothetical protein Q2T48_33960, partial [Pseudomonas aeruginosa]|nr:hypothetical protein [Pseudomonas aeruginosa]